MHLVDVLGPARRRLRRFRPSRWSRRSVRRARRRRCRGRPARSRARRSRRCRAHAPAMAVRPGGDRHVGEQLAAGPPDPHTPRLSHAGHATPPLSSIASRARSGARSISTSTDRRPDAHAAKTTRTAETIRAPIGSASGKSSRTSDQADEGDHGGADVAGDVERAGLQRLGTLGAGRPEENRHADQVDDQR